MIRAFCCFTAPLMTSSSWMDELASSSPLMWICRMSLSDSMSICTVSRKLLRKNSLFVRCLKVQILKVVILSGGFAERRISLFKVTDHFIQSTRCFAPYDFAQHDGI